MNNWSVTGNLGKDCETNTVGGTTVCNFSVAVKSGYGDKAQTLWVRVALWGKQAESRLVDYLKKGQQVAVCGELSTREYEGKTYLELRAFSVDLVGGRQEGQAPQAPQQPAQRQAPAQQPQGQQAGAFDGFDDDPPF